MLKIGNLKLGSNLILAPMAGVSDLPFRQLNRGFGCSLAFIEMINARSMSYKSRKTQQMVSTNPSDRPLGVQLLGCEQKYILKALDVLKEFQATKSHKFDILDFNAACPAKKVIRRGEGASLLKEPEKLISLLRLLVKNSDILVTLKIRSGWDNKSAKAKRIALMAQDAGISALFIHGRTKAQGYSGSVDYKVIRDVKQALDIPVIASGDLFSPQLIKKMFFETGCDAVAIARGALGNPWIFKQAEDFLKDGKICPKPDKEMIAETMIAHLDTCVDFYGESVGVMKFRKFFIWYTKGFSKIRPLREKSSRIKKKAEMIRIIRDCNSKTY